MQLAAMLLIFPLPWVGAAFIAACIHELGHGISVKLCGGRIADLRIKSLGTVMSTTLMTPVRECICSLAGPIAGLLPLLFIQWVPRTAFCGVVQAVYNLLPVYPLDGGRALRSLCIILGIDRKYCCYLENVLIVLFAATAVFFFLRWWGTGMSFMCLMLLASVLYQRKRYCKP